MRHSSYLVAAILAASVGFAGAAFAQGKVRGVTKDEVIIGLHTDLSGPIASFGVPWRNGQQMRIDEVNAAGGVHGRKLKLIVEDHQYQVPRAVQAANKLIQRDNIFVMVGALGTPQNNAVLADQLKAGVPNLFPATAARQMHEPFHKLKFQSLADYYSQIRAGVKWMAENKGKKAICSLYQDTDFGQEVFEGVRDQVKAMNLKLVESVTNKPTDTDLSAQITKLKAANCDLIVMGTVVRDTIIAYATARKIGWADVDFLGQSASYNQVIAEQPGGITNGFYTMASVYMPYRDQASPQLTSWMDRYKAKFGAEPNIAGVYGYDAIDLTVLALDRAGRNLTVDGLVKGLETIQGYRGLAAVGAVGFGPNKHHGSDQSVLLQIQNGRFVMVDTRPIGF